jgi:Uma2 family endonuclease
MRTIEFDRQTHGDVLMATVPQRCITPEQYLAAERQAETKSEYLRGEVFAMGGASRAHNLIAGNIFANLHSQLRQRASEVYQGDMRVKVTPTGLYTYPDVVVVCEPPKFEDDQVDTLLNPTLLIEVLSKSTEGYDRGGKSEHFRRLQSLREYLLIAQDKVHIERFTRQADGTWSLWETNDAQATIELSTIQCVLAVPDIYAKVVFEDPSS